MSTRPVKSRLRRLLKDTAVSVSALLRREETLLGHKLADTAGDRLVDASSFVRSAIESEQPFFAGRFGSTELEIIQSWRRHRKLSTVDRILEEFATGDPYFVWWRARRRIERLGLRPLNETNLERFANLMVESMEKVDLLGSWVEGESFFSDELAAAEVCRRVDLEPYRSKNPWSKALEGKRVLVVHPFVTSIRNQYRHRRETLFSNPDVLPRFQLLQYCPPRAHHGEIEGANQWFDALQKMEEEIVDIDFEVAIIGAGPFGFPLAARIKDFGKQAIHLGGATQILFGVGGGRWETDPGVQLERNEHWVRPLPEETPSARARRLSGSSYW